ncbi:hypothetical protein TrCOL_g7901 [Triparma columacea]|uniref:Uncharacterized protein n=1 Tax=Triparma columacea TaxID=722753 RepID=A0A9W7G8I7_9STRA|nr:hypothetical protein TrCOL_g7901 [Triparma columacea]
MGGFSSKPKVATCTGIVTDPKTKARGVIQITCPDNLPSDRTVKVIHGDHGPLFPSTEHVRAGGFGGKAFDKGEPLYVTFPKTIQAGQIWEYKVEAPTSSIGPQISEEEYDDELKNIDNGVLGELAD